MHRNKQQECEKHFHTSTSYPGNVTLCEHLYLIRNTCRQSFTLILEYLVHLHVFGLWKQTGAPGGTWKSVKSPNKVFFSSLQICSLLLVFRNVRKKHLVHFMFSIANQNLLPCCITFSAFKSLIDVSPAFGQPLISIHFSTL